MKMKRIVTAAMAAVMAVGILGGCGSDGGKKAGKVEVKVITNERSTMDTMQRLVEDYNSKSENIYISYECKDDSIGDYIKTSYTSKNPPDIHLNVIGELGEEAGWYRPLPEELIAECREDFIESCIPTPDKNGNIYTFGLSAGGAQKLLYNKDLFRECGLDPEKPPKTFDELREYAKIITEKGQGVKYGFAMPLKDDVFARYYIMIPGAPSGLYNRDGFEPAENKFDFSIYSKMINYMREVISDGSVFPTPYTLDNDTARAQFSEGNVGMIFGAAWDVGVYNDQFPAKCDWGIAEYPVFDELKGGYPYGASSKSQWVMSSMSAHPEEQLEVYRWLISEEVAKEQLKNNAITASTRKSLLNNIPEGNKKGAVEFAERVYPLFKIDDPKTPEPNLKISGDNQYTAIKNILLDEKKDVDAELKALTDKYNTALDKYAKELEEKDDTIERYHQADWSFIETSVE